MNAMHSPIPLAASLLTIISSASACDSSGMYSLGDELGADAQPRDGDAGAIECVERATGVPSGTHFPGAACQGCHGPGGAGNAPRFTLAGTLFQGASGTAARAEATITVVDGAGKTFELPSAQNGNFWTSENVVFPVRVHASLCPDAVPMEAEVAAPGDCNAGGCHTSGSQIHLP
jgi:hypothetical protein